MKSNESDKLATSEDVQQLRQYVQRLQLRCWIFVERLILACTLVMTLMLLASCSSLGKPEQPPSNLAPACNQREPALDSGDPPEDGTGGPSTDWMAWAQAYVRAQWAVVDRDNKRAATADCLDELARSK